MKRKKSRAERERRKAERAVCPVSGGWGSTAFLCLPDGRVVELGEMELARGAAPAAFQSKTSELTPPT